MYHVDSVIRLLCGFILHLTSLLWPYYEHVPYFPYTSKKYPYSLLTFVWRKCFCVIKALKRLYTIKYTKGYL